MIFGACTDSGDKGGGDGGIDFGAKWCWHLSSCAGERTLAANSV